MITSSSPVNTDSVCLTLDNFTVCNFKLGEGIELWIIPKARGCSVSLMFGPTGDTALQLVISPDLADGQVRVRSKIGSLTNEVPVLSESFQLDKEAHVAFIFTSYGILVMVDDEILTLYPHLLVTPKITFVESTTDMHIRLSRLIPRYMDGLERIPLEDNLTFSGVTGASSQSSSSDHSSLVDGDPSQGARDGICWSPSIGDKDQWVMVDLGGYFFVREVILYGRSADPCGGCADTTHDFVIDGLQTDAIDELRTRCAVYDGAMPLGAVEKIRCKDDVWGRYIRIQATDVKDDYDRITFCEIEVYGDLVNYDIIK